MLLQPLVASVDLTLMLKHKQFLMHYDTIRILIFHLTLECSVSIRRKCADCATPISKDSN